MKNVLQDNGSGHNDRRQKANNLRYADDKAVLEETREDLTQLLEFLEEESSKAGLMQNASKTKIMTTDQLFIGTL